MNIVVGTRGSNLALIQTEWVINELKRSIQKLVLRLKS
ncbi:hypothetical protein ACK2FO_17865 [Clostridioides difficile]